MHSPSPEAFVVIVPTLMPVATRIISNLALARGAPSLLFLLILMEYIYPSPEPPAAKYLMVLSLETLSKLSPVSVAVFLSTSPSTKP